MQKITKKDFEKYVSGWLFTTQDFERDALDIENIHAALANALSQLYCDQDGVYAVTARRNYNERERLRQIVDEDEDEHELCDYFRKIVREEEESTDIDDPIVTAINNLTETIKNTNFYRQQTYFGPR